MTPTPCRVIPWVTSGAFTMRPGDLALSNEHKLFFCPGGCRQVLALDDHTISCYQPLTIDEPIHCPNHTICPPRYYVRDGTASEA